MLHYHVWFNLKPGVDEQHGLAVVTAFLDDLCERGASAGFRLLRNLGPSPRTQLPRDHALVEFADSAALENAMRAQRERGIFAGLHGAVVDVVSDFHVEIFQSIERPTG